MNGPIWGCLEYRGKKHCMYCGHSGELVWSKDAKRTKHVLCKACASELGYWSRIDVDWERVRFRDELGLISVEDQETPLMKRRCNPGMICYCAPFEENSNEIW